MAGVIVHRIDLRVEARTTAATAATLLDLGALGIFASYDTAPSNNFLALTNDE